MTDARGELAALAAEIRKHIAEADDHVPDGYWWYDDGRDGDLPEALAADLLAAGWRAPTTCQHAWEHGWADTEKECQCCHEREPID